MEPIIKLTVIIIAALVMLASLWGYFLRLKAKNQGFGPNSLKALGVILFVPTVLILSVSTAFHSETLAALLGTVAGYVLSRGTDKEE